MSTANIFRGVIRGNSIELSALVGLADGQEVSVIVTPTPPKARDQTAARRGSAERRSADGPTTRKGWTGSLTRCGGRACRHSDGAGRMSFVLDTDICSAHLRGNGVVQNRFLQYTGGLHLSVVTLAELYTWVYRGTQTSKRLDMLERMLSDVRVLIDEDIAERFGQLQADMYRRGDVVATADLLIAVTALHHDFTVVTHNVRHFTRSGAGTGWRSRTTHHDDTRNHRRRRTDGQPPESAGPAGRPVRPRRRDRAGRRALQQGATRARWPASDRSARRSRPTSRPRRR